MKKSDIKKMPKYFDRYIDLAEDVSLLESLQISLEEIQNAPTEKWKALGEKTYEKGKWTIKDILQHYIDVERIFAYRITAITRGDKQKMIPFDEENYAKNTTAHTRTIDDLVEELILVRKGTIAMYKSFNTEMLHQSGNAFDDDIQYCPLSLGFMLAGHQRWHFRTIEQRYFPLLDI